MKNNKNIIVSIVCVSILFPILLFISFYAVLLPSIIAIYSNILFIIIFIFVPMLLLILLIKSSIKYKNNLKKMIGFNILYFLTYILIILLVRYIIIYRLSVYNYYFSF